MCKVEKTPEGGVLWNKKRDKPLKATQVKYTNDEFNLTLALLTAIAKTKNTFQPMGVENLVNFANILQSLNYNSNNDTHSIRRRFFKTKLQKKF